MEKAAILLSTFNGEQWLPSFLQSLADQSVEFILVWRDDGSHDASVEIVRQHKKLRLMEAPHSKPGRNLGPILSFSSLLELALEKTEADYFFFADQDDEWCSTKLEEIIAYISDLNQKSPLIVHHDLEVVDQFGVCIAGSLWGYMGLDKSAHVKQRLQYPPEIPQPKAARLGSQPESRQGINECYILSRLQRPSSSDSSISCKWCRPVCTPL
jgi:glycosyltransferase involved in cell wall biosynthesis